MTFDKQTNEIIENLNLKAKMVLRTPHTDALTEHLRPAPPAAPPIVENTRTIGERIKLVQEVLAAPVNKIDYEPLMEEMEKLSVHPEVPVAQRIEMGRTLSGVAQMLVDDYQLPPALETHCKRILGK